MIIYPRAFVLSTPASKSLTLPRILHQNHLRDLVATAVSVSTETAEGPKDSPLRPDTGEYWRPSALPAYWQADLGAVRTIDSIGIAGADLGSCGAAVECRISDEPADFDSYVSLPGQTYNYISTPDTAANSVTGNIDLRAKITADDWSTGGERYFFSKGILSSARGSFVFAIRTSGNTLGLYVSLDGSTWAVNASSTAGVPFADGAGGWVRVTRDSATGDVKFYTSTDYDSDTGAGTWSQLGTTVSATAGAIYNSTDPVELGTYAGGASGPLAGRFYCAEIRNGIGGAVVARFRADDAGADGATSVTSSLTGEVWTVNQSGSPKATLVLRRFSLGVSPGNDAPLLFMDTARDTRFLRLVVTGTGVIPRIPVIYCGEALVMPRSMEQGFKVLNLNRETVLTQGLSRGGQFLGQTFRRLGMKSAASFTLLDAAWYRANFDPFVKDARKFPYFFAWHPQSYPDEVGFVWTGEDFAPVHTAFDLMSIGWSMRGIGHE